MQLIGSGFIVTPGEAKELGLGEDRGLENHIKPYRNGKDLTNRPRGVMVVDLFGLTAEEVRQKFPKVYQLVLTRVKPERDTKGGTKDGAAYAKEWWLFGKTRKDLRPALHGLSRFIASPATAKHRFFVFLAPDILPDDALITFAFEDAFSLGVFSSRIHVVYSLAAAGVPKPQRRPSPPSRSRHPNPQPSTLNPQPSTPAASCRGPRRWQSGSTR
jgi:hypothetical protein